MKNIAVFASGRGSNFQAIIDAVKNKRIKANLSLLVSDNPQAAALEKARKSSIKIFLARREDFLSRESFEKEIIRAVKRNKIDLIVLAGFMRVLSPGFVKQFKNRIINIHPALLPSFKGAHGIKDAFDYGVKKTGVTVHFVDEKTDHGPIILQQEVGISHRDTLKSLEEKIHKVEHKLYPEAVRLYLSGRIKVCGRKTRIT
ncbi:MAG: phosphoribosylglycinamide formyltransferase [Candidatus Omnitrophica bacterium]|jgi:phosphoribosylglycinamide formyltransferase-1|nr:phosphoribosylglycinamide formyltransferase [Candidatus Omnitrophota bacterium]